MLYGNTHSQLKLYNDIACAAHDVEKQSENKSAQRKPPKPVFSLSELPGVNGMDCGGAVIGLNVRMAAIVSITGHFFGDVQTSRRRGEREHESKD